jgi:hypothetical protein
MPDRPSPNHPIERMSSDSFACPRPPLMATLGSMGSATIDFVTRGERDGTWTMVLVEEGPWLSAEVEANLRRLQGRLYGCIDAALDGQLAELYPETQGGQVIVRVDGYDLPQEEVREFFARFSSCVLHVPGYAAAFCIGTNGWAESSSS